LFIDLIDALRCPADHPPSTLVAAFETIVDRDVVTGMLGCPVCRSEFQVRDGDLWLVTTSMPAPATRAKNPEEDALRLAASLDLRAETGFAILRGAWCALAEHVVAISPTHLVLLDPPLNTPRGPGRSVIHAGGTVPFAPASAVAATIDDDERAYALALAVRPGGRVVGPTNLAAPSMVKELARDDRWWVGERENASAPVGLRRG
ncbi:MAG TPA: hypothetical protein VFO55_07955, partial [Gemmatimonadaceae bacterium]|nr:hypothetical protein [Gemmatimonadaceae bacterium]